MNVIFSQDPHYVSLSFGSISAVGKNAAIIHYATDEGDDSRLTKDQVYMLDAGAQYQDCSTDVTRTHHYGTPKQEEIVCGLNFKPYSTNCIPSSRREIKISKLTHIYS